MPQLQSFYTVPQILGYHHVGSPLNQLRFPPIHQIYKDTYLSILSIIQLSRVKLSNNFVPAFLLL